MLVTSVFETKYLGAADLQNDDGSHKSVNVIITDAEVVELENSGRIDKKIGLSFKGAKKQLLLNRTNANSISDIYGPDTDGWIGKSVKLIVARVDFQGKRVPAIRIDPPDRTNHAPGVREQAPIVPPAPPKMAPQVPAGHPAFDDDVPF